MYAYDDLDRKLIALLRIDGRAPISQLATALGVSRATVQIRIDRMVDNGSILGFTVRTRQYEKEIRAIMLIEVVGKSTANVIRSLRTLPELHTLYTTNGSWDLIAEIHTDSLQSFDRVLREVRSIDGVLNSETSLMLSSI